MSARTILRLGVLAAQAAVRRASSTLARVSGAPADASIHYRPERWFLWTSGGKHVELFVDCAEGVTLYLAHAVERLGPVVLVVEHDEFGSPTALVLRADRECDQAQREAMEARRRAVEERVFGVVRSFGAARSGR